VRQPELFAQVRLCAWRRRQPSVSRRLRALADWPHGNNPGRVGFPAATAACGRRPALFRLPEAADNRWSALRWLKAVVSDEGEDIALSGHESCGCGLFFISVVRSLRKREKGLDPLVKEKSSLLVGLFSWLSASTRSGRKSLLALNSFQGFGSKLFRMLDVLAEPFLETGSARWRDSESRNVTSGGKAPAEKGGSARPQQGSAAAQIPSEESEARWHAADVRAGGGGFGLTTAGGESRVPPCETPCASELLVTGFLERVRCFPAFSYFFLNWKMIYKGEGFLSPPSPCFPVGPVSLQAVLGIPPRRCSRRAEARGFFGERDRRTSNVDVVGLERARARLSG